MSTEEFEQSAVMVDPLTLREHPIDAEALESWCAANPEDPRTVEALRVLGRLEEAEALARRALEDPGLHPVARAVRRTRYAQVLQWQGRFEQADEEFSRAAEETGLSDDPTSGSSILALAAVLHRRAISRFEHAFVAGSAERPHLAARLRGSSLEDARRALAIRTALHAPAAQITASEQTVERLARED